MSTPLRLAIAGLLALAAATPASPESLSERRAAKDKTETVEVEVACGKLDKENCAVVIPEINAKTVAQNVRLKPLASKGSVESVDGLCDGDVQVAVVQADVLAARSARPDCAGKVVALGRPLYPYEGFMVVRADQRESKFGDMVAGLASGTVLRVAAGGSGSGGDLTLRNILASAPDWKQLVDISPDGSETALNKLRDRQLDAFFVMDGPQSPLLQDVRDTVDPKTKQRVFKFVDLRPGDKLLAIPFNGRSLYATVTLESGWFSAIKSISTPAVIAVRDDFYQKYPDVTAKIRQGGEDALPAIAAKAGARPDWAKDFERR
ncbi:NMT1 family protein [Roseiarcus fermentans]|uniref:NMT1 family protein n=1 Tax=Roseiarcus fermentans TaxID=1473586 RepID=A0A366EN10_9HYPH|nr:TAXI family TRAP transporter solute-binding subunit [Roseiarcus fermentans]RBP03090.1 NMT1 family protein [Roseiarcus fermentans]